MTKTIVNIDGKLKYRFESDLERYRIETIYDKEPETIAWIDNLIGEAAEKDLIFFDVGANIGLFSLYAATRAENVKVYSFEPVRANYQSLQDNAAINTNGHVNAFRCAISNENRLTTIYLNDARVGNSGAQIDAPINESNLPYDPIELETVMCFSIDWLVGSMGFPCPNFIKIDVDGKEAQILERMALTLKNTELKSMLVEFNNGDERSSWINLLGEEGFAIDLSYEMLAGHSSHRRSAKGSAAVNCVFTRIES